MTTAVAIAGGTVVPMPAPALTPGEVDQLELARIDQETALRFPDLEDVKRMDLSETAMRKLGDDVERAYDLAARGPQDYGASGTYRPEWPVPVRQLQRERAVVQQARALGLAERVRVLVAYRDRWLSVARLPEQDRKLLSNRENVGEFNAQQQQIAARAAAQAGVTSENFSASAFLARIAGRGGVVVLAADGSLRISPRSVVNDTDRRDLRDHKAEVVAALGDCEVF